LFIVNLKPFYDSALAGDLTLFEEFKLQLQQELEDRDDRALPIVADCADNLISIEHFDQCELVDRWWQDNYMEWRRRQERERDHITVICPHLYITK
jgi:hypothetical protein